MPFRASEILTVSIAFILAVVLTPIVRALARRLGAVAKPKEDRWHKKPTAMLGGIAIFVAVVATSLIELPRTPYVWVVIGSSSFLFFVGLADDIFHAKPYQKLIGQIMGSAFVVYYGLNLPWTRSLTLNMVITMFWLIGITNAVNLLDNMDGLAGGISAISSIFLAISFATTGQPHEALILAIFAAALVGFLIYNSNPASIFMGDCGSMFIGFFLASTALMSSALGGRSRSFLPVLMVPILILFIPIFDTTFVTLLRKLSGRAASQGGRDHTSHRLVALGMSERRAVWMLYGFAALSGGLALTVRNTNLDISLAVIVGFMLLLTLLGVYLAGVKVYDEEEVRAAREKPLFAFLVDLSYKRRIFEVFLDVGLIMLAYYISYVVRFGPMTRNPVASVFLYTLPVVVFIKMATFLVMGVYRGMWRYTSVDDLVVFAKAVALSSILCAASFLIFRKFSGVPRAVLILDGAVLLMMVAGTRLAFRLFRKILPTNMNKDGNRVLIFGAGDGGELLLREMLNNDSLQYSAVGFIDDDPNKKGKLIHGLKVFGGNGQLRAICRQHRVSEVVISSLRISEERINQLRLDCEAEQVRLKRMTIHVESLD
jgi:UDP-GlcNAc:undecaprenyl-phosphate GlcNAc-1-phosphate transferase